jgi:two-component system, sensor histidine kinase and response regulator
MKKILIIEDELLLREGISEILTYEGFKVFEAENGEKGLLAVAQYAPDLILCDIMMPVMDGYEVLNHLRKDDTTKLIPFIFMTALTEKSDQRLGMELGSDDYITKPYTRGELLNAVKTRLTRSDDIKEHQETSLNELRENIMRHLPHEMRTPLNVMIGFGQQLSEYPDTVSHKDLSAIGKYIYLSALRLSRLIQNYLIYTQLELKKGSPTQKSDAKIPDKICQKIVADIATKYNRLNDLELKITDGAAYIGEAEFSKIVEELTENAFKFSETGKKVIVSGGVKKERYHLTIEDHGRGIAATDIPKIGAFMQFDRKIHEQQGSGLGLIIAKKIVELYDGEFSVVSTPGEGTTIHVTLPGQ